MRFLDEDEIDAADTRMPNATANGAVIWDACPEWLEDEPGYRYRYRSDANLELMRHIWRFEARSPRPWYRDIENRWRLQLFNNIHRAKSAGLEATLTMREWRRVVELFQGACAYCEADSAKCMDHVFPLSRGSGTTAWNVVPVCRHCNSTKHARTPSEWLPERRAAGFFEKCLAITEKAKTP